MSVLLAAILGYALGSIPFGLVLSRMAGLGDIRAIGSGNIGATNVLRTGRKDLAAATLLLDAAKGAVAVLLLHGWGDAAILTAGVAAVAGHCTSPWVNWRGGKGVATGIGVLLAWAWPVGLALGAVWLGMVALTRMSSAGSLTACVLAPFGMLLVRPWPWALAAAAACGIVVLRHHANILRLRAGTEPRIGRGA